MPFRIPLPLLVLWLPAQAPSAPSGRSPLDLATDLLAHERMDTNERWAVQAIRNANYDSVQPSPPSPPPPTELRYGYRLRLRTRPFTAVPETPSWDGLHGFCSDAYGHICYTERGVEPSIDGRCSPSCRDLPADGSSLLAPPKFSAAERTALTAALDAKELFPGYPATVEQIRALLANLSRPDARERPAHSVSALAFTGDGTALVSADTIAETATLWSVSSRQPLGRLTACEGIHDVLVTPDGATAVTTCRTAVKLWSLPGWTARGALGRFELFSIDLSLDKSGKTLATVSGAQAGLWQLPSGRATGSIETTSPARVLGGLGALSPDGGLLVTGGLGQPTALWSVAQGTLLATLEQGARQYVTALAISPDGRMLAAAYSNGTVAFWELPGGRPLARRSEHGGPLNSLAFSADGRELVTASSDHSLKVWTLPDAAVRQTLRGHGDEVFAVAVSSAGLVASGDRTGVIRLWDLTTGAPKGELVDPGAPARRGSRPPRP
jgi:WD40 repeat protein